MSSSNGQPPLTRRQVRDLERAREAATGSISIVPPRGSEGEGHDGSPDHAGASAAEFQPAPSASSAAVAPTPPPASIPYGEPGHVPTRRELRAQRDAAEGAVGRGPVPLKAPTPTPERDLSEVLSDVADFEQGRVAARSQPAAPEAPAAAPASAAPAGDDHTEAALPTPVSVGRPSAVPLRAPSDEPSLAPTEDAEVGRTGPMRRGSLAAGDATLRPDASPSAPDAGVTGVGETPPPTSVPTVFPFQLSSPEAPAATDPDAPTTVAAAVEPAVTAPAAPAGPTPAPLTPAPLTPAPLTPASQNAAATSAPAAPGAEPDDFDGDTLPPRQRSTGTASFDASASRAQAGSLATGPMPAAPAPTASTPVVEQTAVASAASGPTPAALRPAQKPTPAKRPTVPASLPSPVDDEGGASRSGAPKTTSPTTGFVPPVGHWSTQAERDDLPAAAFNAPIGQQNAIVLGNDQLPDITGALNATGEVIITGSIDLPRSLAATGSHHIQRIDGADVDRMLEEGDSDNVDNEATPVRASRAVSANTSTRQVVLTAGNGKSSRLPMIAMICGGVVIVGIVVLVVVGFTRGIL